MVDTNGGNGGGNGGNAGNAGNAGNVGPVFDENGEMLLTDVYGNVRGGTGEKPKEKPKNRYTPDKIEEISNVKDADNPMDLLWQEGCVRFFDWTLNTAIKLGFKICDLALIGKDEEEIDTGNKDYFSISDGVFNKANKELKANRDRNLKAFAEINKNIEKSLNGEAEDWENGVPRPQAFDELLDIARKAKADENSDEAKLWEKIQKTPEVIEAAYERDSSILRKGITVATLEVMSGKRKPTISQEFDNGLTELAANVEAYRRECSGEDRKDILKALNKRLDRKDGGVSGGSFTDNELKKLQQDLADPTQTDTRAIINRHLTNIKNSAAREHLTADLAPILEKMDNYLSRPEVTKESLQAQITNLKDMAPAGEEMGVETKKLLTEIGEDLDKSEGKLKKRNVRRIGKKIDKIRELPTENNKYIAQAILEGGKENATIIQDHMHSIINNTQSNEDALNAIHMYDSKLTTGIDKAVQNMRESVNLKSKRRVADVEGVVKVMKEPVDALSNPRDVKTTDQRNTDPMYWIRAAANQR